ncbi:MAG: hypothetical protein WBO47_13680 [Gammaproteobacteria bacterium]
MNNRWDPYDVWNRLLHDNPVCVEDPGHSIGEMDAGTAREFWASVADYPDPLQDALFVIAHARGFPAAIAALDKAIRDHLQAVKTIEQNQATPAPTPTQRPLPQTPDFDRTDILFQRPLASSGH